MEEEDGNGVRKDHALYMFGAAHGPCVCICWGYRKVTQLIRQLYRSGQRRSLFLTVASSLVARQ